MSAATPAPDSGELLERVYDGLRRLAAHYLQRERGGHTLQPTALVHEAYMRLADQSKIEWQGKTHFFAIAATQMRRVLVEHARAGARIKRGGGRLQVTLHDGVALGSAPSLDLLAIDEALDHLARRSPRQSRVAELRLFAGLGVAEVARVVDVSERTVKQDWKMAQAWISRRLFPDADRSSE
jgi:RNA polymerase sigma-70 factor (ECF subfamily)